MFKRFFLIGFMAMATCGIALAFPGDEQETRYGTLSISDENDLLYKGTVVEPKIRGNDGLSFEKAFRVGDTDVVLLQNAGGSGCPAQYVLIAVSKSGISQSPEFGTCSDLIKTSLSADVLTLTMPKMGGKGNAKYVFSKGKLTENGKPVQ